MAYFTAFMAVVQFMQESNNAKTEKEMNLDNAQLQREEDQEATRRARKELKKKESTAKARAAASGVDATVGSSAAYLDELKKTNASEIAWMNKATASRFELSKRGANIGAQAGQTRALGNLTTRVTGAFSD